MHEKVIGSFIGKYMFY
ncbi:hypothetical protein ACK1L6_002015 [Salmonella enterica]